MTAGLMSASDLRELATGSSVMNVEDGKDVMI